MTAETNILELATRFNFEQGKNADYYQLHSTWCVTKRGAAKIREAEGITFAMPEADITPVSIAYRSTFSDASGASVCAVGSCRWDTGKKNPEATHAPEMAWKRMLVRGTLEVLGASAFGIYGDEEFTDEFRKGQPSTTGDSITGPLTGLKSAPPIATVPPATTTTATATPKNPDGTADYDNDPRLARASKAAGWFESAADLPHEWNDAMAKFCEITGMERGIWETRLFDHCGKFQSERGWWKPSTKYKTFDRLVFAVDDYQGANKSKAGFAVRVIKELRQVLDDLEAGGVVRIEVPEGGSLQATDITIGDQRIEPETHPETKELVDAVAKNVKANDDDDDDLPF